MSKRFRFLVSKRSGLMVGLFAWFAGCGYLLWSDYARMPFARWREQQAVSDQRGFVQRRWLQNDGTTIRLLEFVPRVDHAVRDGKYPAILFLHGMGDGGEDGLRQIANTFGRPVWEMQESFPFYVIAPQIRLDQHWSSDAMPIAMAALDQAIAERPIDPNRVILSGVSSGAAGLLELATQSPERFAKVVPVSTTSGDYEPFVDAMAIAKKPVWMFYNVRDAADVALQNRQMGEALKQAEVPVEVTAYERTGHDAWNYAYRDPALY